MYQYLAYISFDRELDRYTVKASKSNRKSKLRSGISPRASRKGNRSFDLFVFARDSKEAVEIGLLAIREGAFLWSIKNTQ